MFFVLLFTLASFMFLWLYLRWRKVKQFWAIRNVPHDPPHPFFGSLRFLQKENPAIFMRDIYRRYRTPYVGIWNFWRPALVINSPEIARRVLIKDSDNFRDRLLSSGKNDPIGGLNLFTVNDPIWTILRRHLTAVFTASRLRGYQNVHQTKANELIQRIENDTKKNIPIDLRRLFTDYTSDITGINFFGIECDATLTGKGVIRTVTNDFMVYNVFRGLCWSSIFFWPEIVDYFGFSFFPRESTNYFKKAFRSVVKQRGGYDMETTGNKDLLDALVKMKQENKDGIEITEELILAQAVIFIQGSFDTTGSALTMAVYELTYQPEYQETLYQELMELKQNIGDRDFDAGDLYSLPFLNAVIKEVLRKYPVMGWLDRIAAKPYTIVENLTIPAGTPIYVNAVGMHYDEDYFPDPMVYNPYRFMPENQENLKPFTYMPFGEGPRVCIGQRFAMQTTRCALAKFFYHYKTKMLPNSILPNDVSLEKRGLFLIPCDPLSVEFIRRN